MQHWVEALLLTPSVREVLLLLAVGVLTWLYIFKDSIKKDSDQNDNDDSEVSENLPSENSESTSTEIDLQSASDVPERKRMESECQTEDTADWLAEDSSFTSKGSGKSRLELISTLEKSRESLKQMSCEEILELMNCGKIRPHQLENDVGDELKAVHIRREWFALQVKKATQKDTATDEGETQERTFNAVNIPYLGYDYSYVSNTCCENVVGTIPLPLGYAGPLTVNGRSYFVPMATTEGCLVASTNRGCRAVSAGKGVNAFILDDGMTRGPVVRFNSAGEALKLKKWMEKPDNFRFMQQRFEGTSRFAKLKSVTCKPTGKLVFLRFKASTGDAMGMNMVSKGTDAVLKMLAEKYFHGMEVVSLSGNYCVDKKPAALNWIEGRGKSVVCDAVVPASIVKNVLKSDVQRLVRLNLDKNFVGSAVAGNLGGFNAHSANIVTAIFLATGQDAAQNISSSNCITQLEETPEGDLYMSCTMPSLEVGTVGGGTVLPPQRAALQILGCAGSCDGSPGEHAQRLALIVASTVLAGELSLLAALSSDDLVRSHIRYNRSSLNLESLAAQSGPSQPPSFLGSFGQLTKKLVDSAESSASSTSPETCSKVLP